MAPLPNITGVFRLSIDWPVNLGVKPTNVFHFLNISGDEAELADNFAASQQTHQWEPISQAYDATSLSIIKLDGHSATQVFPVTPGDIKGEQVGSDQIAQACAVVSYHTGQRGPRGRGRTYVGPITEASQANGVLNSTIQGHMATAWGDFLDAMATLDYSLVVASYAHHDANGVTAVNVDSIVGTQRRRLDQLR
jgi:hypothetical protein